MTENRYDILVAEDEAIVALEIKQLLSRNDYNVVGVVNTGEDLIELCKEKNPDVIVSDINLQGSLSGIDAAKIIHNYKSIPIIFVTGFGDNSTYMKAMTASPSAFLLKPFNEQMLVSSIRNSLE